MSLRFAEVFACDLIALHDALNLDWPEGCARLPIKSATRSKPACFALDYGDDL